MAGRTTKPPSPRQGARLVLASASPRRLELLARAGIVAEVAPADVDERLLPGEAPAAAARRLAALKADRAAGRLGAAPALVLAADTIVAIDGASLGKPADAADAAAMLARLSGRSHEVHTGFALVSTSGPRLESVVTTRVHVKALDRAEIDGYVATGEPFDKAGGYAIQGAGAALVQSIEGSVTNVIGLPLVEVLEALAALGGPRAFARSGAVR